MNGVAFYDKRIFVYDAARMRHYLMSLALPVHNEYQTLEALVARSQARDADSTPWRHALMWDKRVVGCASTVHDCGYAATLWQSLGSATRWRRRWMRRSRPADYSWEHVRPPPAGRPRRIDVQADMDSNAWSSLLADAAPLAAPTLAHLSSSFLRNASAISIVCHQVAEGVKDAAACRNTATSATSTCRIHSA